MCLYLLFVLLLTFFLCFFFKDTATTEIYTLSLHDALPIYRRRVGEDVGEPPAVREIPPQILEQRDQPVERSADRSEEHTPELQAHHAHVDRHVLEKQKKLAYDIR